MIIINYNCNNPLEWTVFKGLSKDVEDFTRSKVMLFAISETNKIPLAIESKDDGCIKATIPAGFEIPTGLTALTYDTELIWIKNGRDVNRTYQYNVFKVDISSTALEQTVRIKSTALVYGYDGLSAYEIAMMKAENPKSENEWLRDLLSEKADKNGNSSEDFSANNIIVLHQVIANSIKNSIDHTRHGIMVPAARTDAEYMLTTSDGERYGCSLSYSNKKIKLLGDNSQELSFIEAYDKQDADNIFEDLADRINEKADTNVVYTKEQIDNQMTQKANVSYVDDNFATKTSVYTTIEVDSALGLKANKIALENAEARISDTETDIDNIEATIPSLASSSNQLADKEFVNSSISTNTATFRGTYNLVTDLELAISASRETIARNIPRVVSSADNNDYTFVQIPTSDETPTNIVRVERYKFNGSEWAFEYELNNSGFTAEQWAAISSGVTSTHVLRINGLDAELASKQDILTFDSAPTANSFNPVTSNGLYIALQNILSTSGGTINGTLTMNGNIDMLMDSTHSWNSIKTTTGRNLFCFKNGFNGYMIGDESIKLGIQTGSDGGVPTPIYHRITVNGTDVDYPVLDTYNLPANVKTINNISVAGAGNIDINDAFKVVYGVTPIADVVNAYSEGKHIYAVEPILDENFNIANVFVLYSVKIDDINNTDHRFAFLQYEGDSSDVSWFELTSDGYSEIYYSTIATTGDLTAALSDYTTTSDLTTLLNNKQNTVDSNHKLSADVIDDSSATNKFVTSSDKTLWNTVTEKAPLPFVITCGIDPGDTPFVNSTLDEIWVAYQNGKNIRVNFAKAGGVSFEDDATLLLDGSRNCVAHTVHDGTHYVVTIYDNNGTTTLSYEETYGNPEIVNLTDGEHRSGYYEDLMRTVGVVKLDIPQIFIYTAYDNNHIATTAMCFSTCTNTESPTNNAVVKQTLLLGTLKSIRTLRNIIDNNKYEVVDNWAQVIDVKQSDLDAKVSKSGSSMTGDLNLADHELQVRANRNGIKFENSDTGVLIGNGNMYTTIQSSNADLRHRKGSTDYTILDTSNVKTINGNSINGSGDITIDVSQFVTRSVNDLVNYYTKSDTYTQSEINTLLGNLNLFKYEIYTSTSEVTSPANNVLYLIGPTGSGNDQYEEYVYANNTFVKIGDTSIDLSGYVTTQALNATLTDYTTTTDLNTLLNGKQATIDASHKLSADLIDDTSSTNKFVTASDKTTWSGKQDSLVSGTNIKTINNQSVLGNGNLDVKDVFIAEYGVTTYQQVLDAYNAGKIVIAIKGDLILTLSRNYDQKFYFECGQGDTTFNVRVSTNDEWAYYAYTLEFTSNKATDFTTLNNTKYPTTQAVADYAQSQTAIVSVASGTTTLSASINTYYDFAGSIDALAITLPVMTSATTNVKNIIFNLACGSSPAITINGGEVESTAQDVVYFTNYLIEANKAYEINALWNGTKWVVGANEIAIPTEVEEAEE